MKITQIILDENKLFVPADQERLNEAVRLNSELGDAFWSEPVSGEQLLSELAQIVTVQNAS